MRLKRKVKIHEKRALLGFSCENKLMGQMSSAGTRVFLNRDIVILWFFD